MNVSAAIRLKRAVRKSTPEPLPEATILAILNAGRRAQFPKNAQPWHFITITDKPILQQLSTCGEMGRPMSRSRPGSGASPPQSG